ncbi:hypothetical protein ACFQ4U_07030 [Micrococcus antarcticus]
MDSKAPGRNQLHTTSREKQHVSSRKAGKQEQKEKHASHRTQRVKVRGLLMNPSDGDGPVEICVNFQADWELVYKNPEIRIKCLVESCETLLMAKRMNKRGLRFLAVRSGGCSHNLVDMPVEPGELEQDPSTLEGGGGPEGNEHLWNKGRLLKIVQSLGAQAVLEHAPTRADVFLPDVNIALEYQRWDTDFQQRTEQRALAGATTTIWLFPWLPSKTPKSKKHSAFDNQVFKHGGIYVAVKNIDNHYESQCPWEDITQERTARLFASGSIAVFDPDRGALVRTSRSLATILGEIIAGDRILTNTFVFRKRDARVVPAKVWVLRDDLARVESMLTDRRRDATQTTGKGPAHPRRSKARRSKVHLRTQKHHRLNHRARFLTLPSALPQQQLTPIPNQSPGQFLTNLLPQRTFTL